MTDVEVKRPVPPAAKKAAAKKAAAAKKIATTKDRDRTEPVVVNTTMRGKTYRLRGTQYLITNMMTAFLEISEWAEGRDDDDRMTPGELREVSDAYKQAIKVFDARDGGPDQLSSRERVMEALEAGEIDFADFTDAFNKLGGTQQGRGGRPLR